ncbi:hypothetical protein PLESTB_000376800 [Pleodorina starrii]|uniref:tRNA (guanine-N(7)-)-methyltransferase n=1 Tax=Pleodorina starrii TaxID=330485 RepID=A0A9W6EZA6_9CHLO|nr:hypothetical protein PLESTM_000018100 [Pleodorina starrii]GLC50414.1 hypothetical protein PLESTB_000376800 [Pleodorina starrii]GLC64205.1 hypothetical protein PLESTF_000135900 [Pleodorina starrii]
MSPKRDREDGSNDGKPQHERKPKEEVTHPRKRFYRARAHSNPLNVADFDVPTRPDDLDWSEHFPEFLQEWRDRQQQQQQQQEAGAAAGPSSSETPAVRFVDIGCGFGGLLVKLSTIYPDTLMLGMEIRDKVSAYVRERIAALRREQPGSYRNASVLRTNAMKYLPNYFKKGQLTKMFFLFPDPHFKAANHRRRIINTHLLTEYAHLLAPGGWLYTISDVPELGEWMKAKLEAHPLFERVSEEELEADPAAGLLALSSEEGQKVARNGGATYRNVYRRLAAPRKVAPAAADAEAEADA